ncbi:MAG: nucleotidyltransferase domain-containing protein [Candidatus Diapherotrites archaeon]
MLQQYAVVQAIQVVLSRPNRAFSVRGLAKEAEISHGASREALSFMKKKGIVSLDIVGRTYQYRASLESPLCRQWKILFNLDLLADSGVAEELLKKIPHIHSILLYGSFAKGTNDEKSDIDLLVIAHRPAKPGVGFAGKIKREVNLSILSLGEWKRKAEKEKAFYDNVIYDSIPLFGERPVVL